MRTLLAMNEAEAVLSRIDVFVDDDFVPNDVDVSLDFSFLRRTKLAPKR